MLATCQLKKRVELSGTQRVVILSERLTVKPTKLMENVENESDAVVNQRIQHQI